MEPEQSTRKTTSVQLALSGLGAGPGAGRSAGTEPATGRSAGARGRDDTPHVIAVTRDHATTMGAADLLKAVAAMGTTEPVTVTVLQTTRVSSTSHRASWPVGPPS